jgi:hypothetical protein
MHAHLTGVREELKDLLSELLAHAQRHPDDSNLAEIVHASDHVAIALGSLGTLSELAGEDADGLTWRLGSLVRAYLPDGVDGDRLLQALVHSTLGEVIGDVAAPLRGDRPDEHADDERRRGATR